MDDKTRNPERVIPRARACAKRKSPFFGCTWLRAYVPLCTIPHAGAGVCGDGGFGDEVRRRRGGFGCRVLQCRGERDGPRWPW